MFINGSYQNLTCQTVSSLLQTLDLNMNCVVVERNGHIVDRSKYDDRILKADDQVEIIAFVGGG